MGRTVVLVHGAWLNALSWEGWKARFEAKGRQVIAPSWPLDDRPPPELRASPHPDLKNVGPQKIVDHYDQIIRALPEKPIIIGHSAGGVYTQMLLNRGLGAAGVVIDPAPTPGVALGPQAILSAFPVFSVIGSWGKVMHMKPEFFAKRFAQALPEADKKPAYDRYVAPTPGKVYWDGLLGIGPKIAFGNPKRPPMLVVVGEKDLIADASMAKAIYRKQARSPSKTEFREFPGRSHFICAEPGWEEVADFALDWADRNAAA